MNSLQKFIQTRAISDSQIKSYFKSYKKFMNYDKLPDFSIIYTDSRTDKNVDYEAQISFSSHPIRLYVNIAYFDIKSDNTRATMMHEFTHLYDYIILSERYGSDFVIKHFKMYTEFHASQMEILYLHHLIDNINDNIEIIDFTKKNPLTFLDISLDKDRVYANRVKEFNTLRTLKSFERMIVAYVYSCGSTSLFNTLLGGRNTFMPFIQPFDVKMIHMAQALNGTKYNQIPPSDVIKDTSDSYILVLKLFLETQTK